MATRYGRIGAAFMSPLYPTLSVSKLIAWAVAVDGFFGPIRCLIAIDQSKLRLVCQGAGLQSLPRLLLSQPLHRQTPQFGKYQGRSCSKALASPNSIGDKICATSLKASAPPRTRSSHDYRHGNSACRPTNSGGKAGGNPTNSGDKGNPEVSLSTRRGDQTRRPAWFRENVLSFRNTQGVSNRVD
jgi:hypothetical protein